MSEIISAESAKTAAAERLGEPRRLRREIRQFNARLAALREATQDLAAVDTSRVRTTGGGPGRTVEEAILRIDALFEEISAAGMELFTITDQIASEIQRLPEQQHRDVLAYRFLCDLEWPKVQEAMAYSERQTFRIYGDALLAYAGIILGLTVAEDDPEKVGSEWQ